GCKGDCMTAGSLGMPAVSRFGAVAFLAHMACWTGGKATTDTAPVLEPGARDVSGSYWCSMGDDETAEDERFPCVIKKVGGKLMLAKLAGQERIRGNIVLDDKDGFTFIGEMYCPFGDCNQELHGKFKPVGRGGFKGSFREESFVVRLSPAPANAFAGKGYGGDAHGGDPFDYSGPGFGGSSYGGPVRPRRIDIRRRPTP
ncbi:MAG: hypothetical protein ABI867_32760, partial [Kofleriaceae bacterium]